jgi:hypothetical protein
MGVFSILPVIIIFIAIIYVIIVSIRGVGITKNFAENTFQIAISSEDLIRQLLLAFAFIIGITAFYAGFHSLGIEIGWYWFATIGGVLTTYIGYKQHSPITFIIGLLMTTIGVIFGSNEVASNHKIDKGLPFMSAFIIFSSFYGLSVSFFNSMRSKRYHTILNLISILGLGGITFFLGSFGARETWSYIANSQDAVIWTNFKTGLILVGVIGLFIISYIKSIAYFSKNLYQLVLTGVGVIGATLVLVLPNVSSLYDPNQIYSYTQNDWAQKNLEIFPHIISMNVLFLIGVLWLLYSAYKLKEIWRLNLSILALFIFVLVRYFDWVERTELDRSLFFLSLGVVFLITGWVLEKLRKNILASIDN